MNEIEPARLVDLTGRVAVVTGASSGLGERFARVLHAAGAAVVGVARRPDRLASLAAELERFTPLAADVTSAGAAEDIVAAAMGAYGRLDVLVNNAGAGTPKPAISENLDDFRATIELNLVAAFALSRAAARPMLEAGGGSIVNISSIYGLVSSWPLPNASYTASKGAIVQLTRELACQWAADGVRVNALAPGLFPSESTDALLETDQGQSFVARRTPMGRPGRPDELDGALLFLAGPMSTYVTGQVLAVDGGWTAH